MIHPFKKYFNDKTIETMDQISVTLEICTLYKGVPQGIAIINYTDPKNKNNYFRGVGLFHLGKLHNAPFACVEGDGWAYSLTKMQKGRPADGSFFTQFRQDGQTAHVDSWEEYTQVGGW